MDLLIASNSVTQAQADQAPATGTPGWATDGNPATNTPATIFPAYAFNALQAELTAAIQGAGITLDRTKLNQLAAAIQKMTQGASAVTAPDTGSANAYAITLSPAPVALTPGMLVQIDNIVASNAGASTLNVNGLGALPIQGPAGVALQGGELVATYGAVLRLNHAGTAWVLLQTTGGSLPVKPGTQTEHAVNCGQSSLSANPKSVRASRAWDTNYTNSTGRTLFVSVSGSASATGSAVQIVVGGVPFVGTSDFSGGNSSYISGAFAVVPPGATYSVSVTSGAVGTLYTWVEA